MTHLIARTRLALAGMLLALVAAWLFHIRPPRLVTYLSPPLDDKGMRLALLVPAGWREVQKDHTSDLRSERWEIRLEPPPGPGWLPGFLKTRLFPREPRAWTILKLRRPTPFAREEVRSRQERLQQQLRRQRESYLRRHPEARPRRQDRAIESDAAPWGRVGLVGEMHLGQAILHSDKDVYHPGYPSASSMNRDGWALGWTLQFTYMRHHEAPFNATVREIADSLHLVPGPRGSHW